MYPVNEDRPEDVIHDGTPWYFYLLDEGNQRAFIDQALDRAWGWRQDLSNPGDLESGPTPVIGEIVRGLQKSGR
jgi:hypothetical protein